MRIIYISIFATIVFSILSIMTTTDMVLAQNETTTKDIICDQLGEDCRAPTTDRTPKYFTEVVTNVLTTIIASVSVLVLIIAGFMYITSAGNPDKTKKAKNTIMYALIGIVVAGFAQAIVRFILSSV